MVELADVTLSPTSQRYCLQFGVDDDDLRAARATAWSLYERDGWLACKGKLPAAAREVIMFCRSSTPAHVETWRPTS